MDSKTALDILAQGKQTYEVIATDFDSARKELWPGFQDFLKYVKPQDAILDAGCGNGRLTQLFFGIDCFYTGLDNSEALIQLARKNYPEQRFVLGDILNLPFQDKSFDVVFSIAVLHHIPSRGLRTAALQEMKRVLKDGGYLVMTNWNRYTKKYFKTIMYYTLVKFLRRSRLDYKDIMLPWATNTDKLRYYHCFTLGELRRLLSSRGFVIVKSYKDSEAWPEKVAHNLVIIARK